MLAKIGTFAGFLTVTALTALAIFLRYYRNRSGVKSVAVDFEVIYRSLLLYVLLSYIVDHKLLF